MRRFIITLLLGVCSLQVAAQELPDPYVTLGTIKNTIVNGKTKPTPVSVAILLANSKLNANKDGYDVVKFEVSILPSDSKSDLIGPFSIRGNELSAEVKNILQNKVKSGTLFIDDVVMNGPDQRPRNMNSVLISFHQ